MTIRTFKPGRAIVGLAVAVTLGTGLFAASSAEAANGPQITDLADAFMVEQDGGWFCKEVGTVGTKKCADTSWNAATSLSYYFAFNPSQLPGFMRVGKARNDCQKPDTYLTGCDTGVPRPPTGGQTCPLFQYTQTTSRWCLLNDFKSRGVKLGDVLSAERNGPEDQARRVENIAWQACETNKADVDDLYSFIFLDEAARLTTADLKETVRRVQAGEIFDGSRWAPCARGGQPLGGWPLMTNDRNFESTEGGRNRLDTGAWAHAKDLALLNEFHWYTPNSVKDTIVREALNGGGGPLMKLDHDFLDAVPAGSQAVLRFEVTAQTGKLFDLGKNNQTGLLCSLATRQDNRFRLIYPLFVHGLRKDGEDEEYNPPYDSLLASPGTFSLQAQLIGAYPGGTKPADCP